ncbi:MAG: ATP-binding protein [Akkermansia sp.]|nr:ATP-binding protein [Akkermansia sp.]
MNPIRNPFSPGAGSPPPELAGRSDVIETARILMGRIKLHKPEKSLLLTGLRGVGKTVLLNKMEALARDTGYKTIMIEAQEGRPLAAALVPALRNVLYELNLVKNAGEKARRALMILRNFIGSVKLSYGDFGIDLEPLPGKGDTGDMTMDLPELLLSVAEAAEEKESGVVIFIDEMQILAPLEFTSLILAMHKLQQRQAPLVLIGGGLPTIPRLAGEAKSYAERLFSYPIIGQLSLEDAAAALRRPVEQEGLHFTDAAIGAIYRHTQGYPYFLQEWGYQVWNNLPEDAACIQESDVDAVTGNALRRLDENFFRVRYDRLTEGEKHFMRAMAELEPGDCRTADLAKLLGKSVNALAPARSSLIKKGMIYSPRHGVLAYSVPLFGDFMRRSIPVFR